MITTLRDTYGDGRGYGDGLGNGGDGMVDIYFPPYEVQCYQHYERRFLDVQYFRDDGDGSGSGMTLEVVSLAADDPFEAMALYTT